MKLILGPELPVSMKDFSLVSTTQGLLAVGGYDDTYKRNKDEILKLKCQDDEDLSTCIWEEYSKKLDVARFHHVVIPLPASYEICNNWTNLWISNFTWPKNINWSKICKINIEVFYEKKENLQFWFFFSFFCVKKIPFLVQKFNLEKLNLIFISQFLAGKFK